MPDMRQQENGIVGSNCSDLGEASQTARTARPSTAQPDAAVDAGAAIARQLNGPLTALMLYIGELKQHSHQFAQTPQQRDYLQKVVEHAFEQTERVCSLVKRISGNNDTPAVSGAIGSPDTQPRRRSARSMLPADVGGRRLTKREHEVLNLISEGYSNKEGALRMKISPRTFESHRAEAMRKLGARNTADLVRAALSHQDAV